MAHHGDAQPSESDKQKLGTHAFGMSLFPLAIGIAGLVLAVIVAAIGDRGIERFAHSYLLAYTYIATLAFGALALLLITTLFRGHWQILVRRIWETYARMWLPLLLVLALPIILFAVPKDGILYSWRKPTDHGKLQHTHQIFKLEDPALIELYGEFPANYFIDHPTEYQLPALKALQHTESPFSEPSFIADEDHAAGHDEHDHDGDGYPDHAPHEHGQDDEQHASGREHSAAMTATDISSATSTTTAMATAADSADSHGDHADGAHGDAHHDGGANGEVHGGAHGDHDGHDDHGHHAHNNPLVEVKLPYLNLPFWTLRVIFYPLLLGGLAIAFHKRSVKMDTEDDEMKRVELTRANEKMSSWGLFLFGCGITFFSFDLCMSLDPTWYSTMYGIRFFAGSMIAALSLTILTVRYLQAKGLINSINVQHYHDLAKLLFAMVFFWTYVTFSEYMLIWYAEVPGETTYYMVRGSSTVTGAGNAYTYVSLFLLFGHFLFPWLFLLSRHIKRNNNLLCFMAGWMLFAHGVDLFWDIMAEFDNQFIFGSIGNFLIDAGTMVGLIGLFLAFSVKTAAKHHLVPIRDPRLGRSINHENLY